MTISLNDLPLEPVGQQPDIDFNNYADAQEFAPAIPEGTYNFKVIKAEPDSFDTKTGVFTVLYDHEAYDIATGAKVGTLNFDRVSTKVFNRSNIPVSHAADMLRAIGVTQRPESPREWGEQLISAKSWSDQGNFWIGAVQWDGYCAHKETPFETAMGPDKKPLAVQPQGHALPFAPKRAKNWPLEGTNGSEHRLEELPCTVCGKPIRARAKIDRRLPKS